MSCTNPQRMFDSGYLTEKGKPAYIYASNKTDFVYKPITELVARDKKKNKKWVNYDKIITDFIEVPCGKCESCRLEHSKEWMERCMLESKNWKYNEMITLTYDNENLPITKGIDPKTGEILEVPTLKKADITKFMKDLRRYYKYHYDEENIKFYMCGEYGDKYQRPHYHILFFNLNVRDKKFYKYSEDGFEMFKSDIITKIWNKGFVDLNEVNEKTCSYVARYIMKKQKGKYAKKFYDDIGRVAEYTAQSNRGGGIGKNYFLENMQKIYEYDKMIIATQKGAMQIKPCSYYDRLFDIEDHEKMQAIKEQRKQRAEERERTRAELSGMTIEEQREHKAKLLHERLKKLERKRI